MPRQKKPTYEWFEPRQCYRKRMKDSDGKYVAIYGKTPDELAEKIEAAKQAIKSELFNRENPTFKAYASAWIETHKISRDDKNALANHVYPVIGDKLMREISPNDIGSIMKRLDGKSDSLRSKILSAMRHIFEAAEDDGTVQKNPCSKIKAGGKKAKEKDALTEQKQAVLLDAVKGTRADTFVRLGLFTGMRREEILGLKWDSVHLDGDAPYIYVRRSLKWEKCRPIVTDALKSKAAYRKIPIPPQLVDYLKPLQGEPDQCVVGGNPLTFTQYRNLWRIVTRRQTGETSYRNEEGKRVKFVRKPGAKSGGGDFRYTIDFAVSPHLLRHTYISRLILAGVDLKTVQYLAGHETPEITLKIYTHLMGKQPTEIIGKIHMAFGVTIEVTDEVQNAST